jgi:hypothetical protein
MLKILGLSLFTLSLYAHSAATVCTIGQTEFLNVSHPEHRKEVHLNSAIALSENRFLTSAYFVNSGLSVNLDHQDEFNKKITGLGYKEISTFLECKNIDGEKVRVELQREDVLAHPHFKGDNNNFAIIEIYKKLEVNSIETIQLENGAALNCKNLKSSNPKLIQGSDEFTVCDVNGNERIVGINIPKKNLSKIDTIETMNTLTPFITFFNKKRIDFVSYNIEIYDVYLQSHLDRAKNKKEAIQNMNSAKEEIQITRECIAALSKRWIFKPKKRIRAFESYSNELKAEIEEIEKDFDSNIDRARKLNTKFKNFYYKRCPNL